MSAVFRKLAVVAAAFAALVGLSVSVPGAATAAASARIVSLVHNGTGQCLDVYYSSTANGARVELWHCNRTGAQQWVFHHVATARNGVHYYTIVNQNSHKCLEVYYSSKQPGARVDQWHCNGTYTQQWYLDSAHGIYNRNNHLSLVPQYYDRGNCCPQGNQIVTDRRLFSANGEWHQRLI